MYQSASSILHVSLSNCTHCTSVYLHCQREIHTPKSNPFFCMSTCRWCASMCACKTESPCLNRSLWHLHQQYNTCRMLHAIPNTSPWVQDCIHVRLKTPSGGGENETRWKKDEIGTDENKQVDDPKLQCFTSVTEAVCPAKCWIRKKKPFYTRRIDLSKIYTIWLVV